MLLSLFESLWVSWLTRTYVMHSLTSLQQFVSFDREWDFVRSSFRFDVLHMASSGSNRAVPEHIGVTEHVSPGCSATSPQQSDQKQRGDPAHVVPDLRERLEKSGAAEHAPLESSKIGPVTKSDGNVTSTPDAGPANRASDRQSESTAAQRPAAQWLNAPPEAHPGSCRPCWFTAKGRGCQRKGCLFCHKPHVPADVRHPGGSRRQRVAKRNGRDDSLWPSAVDVTDS